MIAQQRQVRSVSAARCTDLLSAKENPDSCNVRRCQKNCDRLLHCQTIDRGAPWALYPAIKRLPKLRPAVPAPSFAMVRSGKSRAKRSGSRPRADSLQPLCRSLVDRRASCSPNRPKAGRRNCGGRASCLQGGARQTALGPAREMSGVKDSGRERGHGDIDANNPSRHFVQQLRPAISIALSALAVLAMTAFIILLDLTTVCLEPA
jgi:hypothetical protein